jgi:hypothetical protein
VLSLGKISLTGENYYLNAVADGISVNPVFRIVRG